MAAYTARKKYEANLLASAILSATTPVYEDFEDEHVSGDEMLGMLGML